MTCRMCGGPLVLLGQLGRVVWSRCRNCGMEHHEAGPKPR